MELDNEITMLAKEILDDAELSRSSAEALVLKATRLALLVKNETMITWLTLERYGYSDKEPDLKYMVQTGRTYDKVTREGFWGSIATQEAAIEAVLIEIDAVKNFIPSGTYSSIQLHNQQGQIKKLTNGLVNHRRIRSIVIASIQNFASNTYYEKIFSKKAGDIFKQYSEKIDGLLAEHTGEVLSMLPSVFERLNNNDDKEAISQALLSCRRILDAFINKLYSPSDTPILLDGEKMNINVKNTKNRFQAYIRERAKSKSVRDKLKGNIHTLYNRTSTAVHDNVRREEAEALVLQLYVTLGEILTLGNIPESALPKDYPPEDLNEEIGTTQR